jgi:hypothetical protein
VPKAAKKCHRGSTLTGRCHLKYHFRCGLVHFGALGGFFTAGNPASGKETVKLLMLYQ